MVPRTLAPELVKLATYYPVVTLTGPRQSGKTTLCKAVFPDRPYVTLEPLDVRTYAVEDPRGFLAEYAGGAILDEVQHAPGLLSYLQEVVDADPTPGRFILTGSEHLGLSRAVAQSLAGRCAVVHLLPLGFDELLGFPDPPRALFDVLLAGAYPRIHDRHIPADRWLADYVTTYIQRDVRQILHIGDLATFTTFLRLVAGRSGQELNLSALGADAGVSHNTARSWLSVLESSFLLFRLPAWHRNVTSQAVKRPKIHLVDSGLTCWLLGIRDAEQLRHHPLRGAIFESWVTTEIYKARVHRGRQPDLYHRRVAGGPEVDLVLDTGARTVLLEAKSGATLPSDALVSLTRSAAAVPGAEAVLVYGGDAGQRRTGATVLPWAGVPAYGWV